MNALTEHLVSQRWFASKAREVSHSSLLDEVELPGGLRLSLVETTFSTGTHETYQLLRSTSEHDAFGEHAETLLALLREGAEVIGRESTVRFCPFGPIGETGPSRPMGSDQSNSTVVFGDELALKVYRRVEPGINPELEITRFLTERGFPHIPALRGWYEIEGPAIEATLGVVQTFVAGAVDGWTLAIDELGTDAAGFLGRLRRLGEVIGAMHTALSSDTIDPAFAPEEPSQESVALLTATIDEEIERLFLELGDREATASIEGRGEEARDRLRLLTQVAVGGRVIRHHGDLHLGQVLLADGDWIVLDFEGEPARPLIERRRKRSPLRDVAGMLRSFAYVASAHALQTGSEVPDGWEQDARRAFLDGYHTAVDGSLLPPGQQATDQLLAVFELEKAVYELRYELNNRPDWVRIPVAGIARLLEEPLP